MQLVFGEARPGRDVAARRTTVNRSALAHRMSLRFKTAEWQMRVVVEGVQ